MDNKDTKEFRIKVGELTGREDFGRGIARIDSKTMSRIGVKEGDVIEIEGKDKTGAIVIRSYPADIGLSIVRMDGLVRKNCDASIGEMVVIRKVEDKEAKKIVLAPAQKGDIVRIHPNLLRQNLFLRPVKKGDIIAPNPVFKSTKSHDEMDEVDNTNINDIFSLFFPDMKEVFMPMGSMGTDIKLVVVDTKPEGIVQISDTTEVELLPEAVAVAEKKMPTVTYEDIGGLSQIVPKIREMIETPLRHPEIFERLGVEPPKGVLLYGPPGTGKTLIAKVVANEAGAHFISVAGPEFMSKFYGESEENLRKIFDDASKNAPTIIFIDEIDAIAPKRDQVQGEVERRVVSTLLTQMDGLKSRGKVIVIAATNLPNMLDPALRRTGRFDREIEIPVPDKKGRKEILQIHTRGMPIDGTLYEDFVKEHLLNKIEIKLKEHKASEAEVEKKLSDLKKLKDSKESQAKLSSDLQRIKTHIAKLESLRKLKDEKEKLSIIVSVMMESEKDFKSWQADSKAKYMESQKINLKDAASVMDNLIDTGVAGEAFFIEARQKGVTRDIDNLAETTFGYVGADISGLAKEAAMHALRGVIPEISALKEDEPIPKDILEKLKVAKEDFEYAQRMVQPSGMREVLMEIPKVKWSDVGGLEEVKESLKEAVIWPLKTPESFTRLGIRPPRGVLLYGPPGTGKTYVVKALANEAGVNLISVKGPELLSMWVGESERHIRDVFRRAKQVAPSIVLFDEIDSLAPKRGLDMGSRATEQVVSQLLTEMSGIEDIEGVTVLATTNRPDMLDSALLRPGRFDRQIYVPAPDEKTRLEILRIHTKSMPLKKDVNLEKVAKDADGYSGADLEAVAREAALFALREDVKTKEVNSKHFEKALKKIRPSITDDMFKKYQKVVDDLKKNKIEEGDKADRYIG